MGKYCPRCKGTGQVRKDQKAGHSVGGFTAEYIPCPMCNKLFNRKKRK